MMALYGAGGCSSNEQITSPRSAMIGSSGVPGNINEAVKWVKSESPKDLIEQIVACDENKMFEMQFSLGLLIRNNILVKDSNLCKFFKKHGVFDKEDMMAIVMDATWRDLHKCSPNWKSQFDYYKRLELEQREYYKKEDEESVKRYNEIQLKSLQAKTNNPSGSPTVAPTNKGYNN